MLKTKFWKKAAASLPANVRPRYIADIEQAERFELALGGAIEAWSRLTASFHRGEPRGAH